MAELLRVEGLTAGYGEARVISNLDLRLEDGKSLALLGRNGVGKTTLLNSLIGVTTRHGGELFLAGVELTKLPPHQRALARHRLDAAGAQHLPLAHRRGKSDRRRDAGAVDAASASIKHVPAPAASAGATWAGRLSGGEQQMLAIGRALVLNPQTAAARRADRGPRADHRRRIARGACASSRARACR